MDDQYKLVRVPEIVACDKICSVQVFDWGDSMRNQSRSVSGWVVGLSRLVEARVDLRRVTDA